MHREARCEGRSCESGCVNPCDLDVEGSVPPLRSNMGFSHSTEHPVVALDALHNTDRKIVKYLVHVVTLHPDFHLVVIQNLNIISKSYVLQLSGVVASVDKFVGTRNLIYQGAAE